MAACGYNREQEFCIVRDESVEHNRLAQIWMLLGSSGKARNGAGRLVVVLEIEQATNNAGSDRPPAPATGGGDHVVRPNKYATESIRHLPVLKARLAGQESAKPNIHVKQTQAGYIRPGT